MEKLALWTAVEPSLRSSFPAHQRIIRAALEDRLEPGPWSIGFVHSDKRPSLARDRLTRDRILAEIGRALSAAHGLEGEVYQRALERWLGDSLIVLLRANLGLAELYARGWLAPRFVAWANHAREAGLKMTSIDALARLPPNPYAYEPLNACLTQVVREIGIDRDESIELRGATLLIARDVLHGRLSVGRGASHLHSLAARGVAGLDRDRWSELSHALALGDENPEAARAVLESVRELLLA